MEIGTLLAIPLTAVFASIYASKSTKASVTDAKEDYANVKNNVGYCPTNDENPENIPETETPVEKPDTKLYNMAYQYYRASLDVFLKEKFPGMTRWEPRSNRLLTDEFHKITVIYENGYRHECMVKPVASTGCIKFSLLNTSDPLPDEKPQEENLPDIVPEEPEKKPKSPVEKVSWLAQNMDWLKEQEKICRQNEQDFFIIDKEHLFSDDDDIIGLSEQLSYYGMLLGSEDGIYTISICN